MVIRALILSMLLLRSVPCSLPSETNEGYEDPSAISLAVSPEVQMRDVPRIGLNLGLWTSWGAEQLGANVIKNPGFEGLVDGALATVQSSNGPTAILEGVAVCRQNGFWNNATIQVRSGTSSGRTAIVKSFEQIGNDSTARVVLNLPLSAMPRDVVAITKTNDDLEPSQWWITQGEQNCPAGPPRTGSPGIRSLVLCSTKEKRAEVNSYLDETTPRSGKLLPIRGKWTLSFWAKALAGHPALKVTFVRTGSSPFLSKEIRLGESWRNHEIEFDVKDDGPDGPLQLQFLGSWESQIAVDDVSLTKNIDHAFPFRTEVVEALQQLNPGYLRDWQGQLGDSISNRLASPFARRAFRYRSDRADDAHYGYSIPEFLELSKRLDANPWLVLPTTASDAEYSALGSYLGRVQAKFKFREILIEFGNENWNPLFGAAGIADVQHHAEVAARAFHEIQRTGGLRAPLRTVLNGQFANSSQVLALAAANSSDMVAIAPYFGYELPANAAQSTAEDILFQSARSRFKELSQGAERQQHEIAVYEVNLHTVSGTARESERNRFVLSPEAGVSLGMRLLDALAAGVRRQCVYALAGFDTYNADHSQFVQLFGVVRDLAGAPRLRPTGSAVALINSAIEGEMHAVTARGTRQEQADLTSLAFRGRQGWSVLLASRSPRPKCLSLSFPAADNGPLPNEVSSLGGEPLEDFSAETTQVREVSIRARGSRTLNVCVAPHSLVALLPHDLSDESKAGGMQ